MCKWGKLTIVEKWQAGSGVICVLVRHLFITDAQINKEGTGGEGAWRGRGVSNREPSAGYNHLYTNTWASVCPLHPWSGGGESGRGRTGVQRTSRVSCRSVLARCASSISARKKGEPNKAQVRVWGSTLWTRHRQT